MLGFDKHPNVGGGGGIPNVGEADGRAGVYSVRVVDSFDHKTPTVARIVGVSATATLSYRGQKYVVDLFPTDGKRDGTDKGDFRGDSARGVVRHFVLKLSGPRPGHARDTAYVTCRCSEGAGYFYGGTVDAVIDDLTVSGLTDASKLVFTLTPTGPLLDGSRGIPIVRTASAGGVRPTIFMRSIPVGYYTATARIEGPGAGPLKVDASGRGATVAFVPTSAFPDGGATILVTLSR